MLVIISSSFWMLTSLFLGQVQICFSECMYPELEVISAHNLAFLVNFYCSFKIQLKYHLLSKTFLGTYQAELRMLSFMLPHGCLCSKTGHWILKNFNLSLPLIWKFSRPYIIYISVPTTEYRTETSQVLVTEKVSFKYLWII